jgi:hypothetical protein
MDIAKNLKPKETLKVIKIMIDRIIEMLDNNENENKIKENIQKFLENFNPEIQKIIIDELNILHKIAKEDKTSDGKKRSKRKM